MSAECETIHKLAWELERHGFPFDESKIPLNGIYLLFQKGEEGHQGERIVRIGTHTGDNQLRSRLKNRGKNRGVRSSFLTEVKNEDLSPLACMIFCHVLV